MTFNARAYTTPKFRCILKNDEDVAVTQLTTLKLTLLNLADMSVVNSRDRQNVLDVNNVTFSADIDGELIWSIQVLDLTFAVETNLLAVFEWTYDGGTRAGSEEFAIRVTPLSRPA